MMVENKKTETNQKEKKNRRLEETTSRQKMSQHQINQKKKKTLKRSCNRWRLLNLNHPTCSLL